MQKELLLLVEDSEDDAFLFGWTFAKSGIALGIHHVRNGREAIDFLRNPPGSLPRIVLLDLKMPVLNGFDVLAWMKKQTFSSPIQVVVVSGSAQQEDKDKAFELGAADYLVKPVKVADLRRLLADVAVRADGAARATSGAHP
jgi:two-component system, response regulator